MQRSVVCAVLMLSGLAFAAGPPTTGISTPSALPAARLGQVLVHIDSIHDRQGNLVGGDVDGASMDSLYWRPASTSYLYVSPKVYSPRPTERTAMSFHWTQSRPCMDPYGDFVYEVDWSNLYRFSTVDGSMTTYTLSPSGSATGCVTDGEYIYVPSSMTSDTIYKYTMTGTYVNTTVLDQLTEQWGMSICRDTFWANPTMGWFTYFAYPTSEFNGGRINYVTSWDVGSGSPANLGNIAYDGTYFHVTWMGNGATEGTFKRFYSDRTPLFAGRVYADVRSCMAVSMLHPPGDVGCTRVIGPCDTIQYCDSVVPQAKVKNYSTVPQTFPVQLDIGTVYHSTMIVTDLAPGDSATVSFNTWCVANAGPFAIKCSTQLSSDSMSSNDKATGACFVPLVDAGTAAILGPTVWVPYGIPITPQARVKNFGTVAAAFTVKFTIGTVYSDSQTVSDLPAGESLVVNFADWAADTLGTFVTQCSTRLSGDQVPANDKVTGAVRVRVTGIEDSSLFVPHTALLVSPNPVAAGFATVSLTGAREQSGAGALRISICDIFGRRVFHSSFDTRAPSLAVDLRSLPTGVYMVEATAKNFSTTRKLVIQH